MGHSRPFYVLFILSASSHSLPTHSTFGPTFVRCYSNKRQNPARLDCPLCAIRVLRCDAKFVALTCRWRSRPQHQKQTQDSNFFGIPKERIIPQVRNFFAKRE